MKCMILAAGLGRRMGRYTANQPKPLIMAKGQSLLEHHLIALAKQGFTDIVINLHYLGQMIFDSLGDGSQFGVKIQYSWEEELLDTGGGIYKALPLLGDEPFLLVNGDLWTDYPYQQLSSLAGDCLGHLVLVDNPDFHPNGDFALDNGLVHRNRSGGLYTYAGIALLSPKLFADVSEDKFSLVDVLLPAIADDKISGEIFTGRWWNVGTPEILADLEAALG